VREAGLSSVMVSSTSRSPADQARVMFANLERFGVEAQVKLYRTTCRITQETGPCKNCNYRP
jgi:hypothetical protein